MTETSSSELGRPVRARLLLLAIVLALTLASARASRGSKTETEKASEALEMGLGAHVQGRLDDAIEAYKGVRPTPV